MKPYQGGIAILSVAVLLVLIGSLFPGGQIIIGQLAQALYSVVSWIWGVCLFLIGIIGIFGGAAILAYLLRSVLLVWVDHRLAREQALQTGYHLVFALAGALVMSLTQIWICVRVQSDILPINAVLNALGAVPKWDFFEHVPTGWAVYAMIIFVLVYALSPGSRRNY